MNYVYIADQLRVSFRFDCCFVKENDGGSFFLISNASKKIMHCF